jgi:isoleucyl-tRNA synthetase
MNVSDEILKRMADAYRRIRNTARYLLSNLNGFDPDENIVAYDDLIELDKWAIEYSLRLQKQIIKAYNNYEFHLIYQLLHQFCVVEMGGFYLDIVKDRQYTTAKDSLARRSTQTAMYHLLQMLARWLAPILSFTADEIWKYIPGEKTDSVFLEEWYEVEINETQANERKLKWDMIITIRDEINKQLEKLRVDKVIGGSLDAEVDLYCNDEVKQQLSKIEDELRFVLITSYARLHSESDRDTAAIDSEIPGLSILVKASAHEKCVRCWHHREDVGVDETHPELCHRCIENVESEGEKRVYA